MKIAIFSDTFLPQINGVTKTLAKMKKHTRIYNIYANILRISNHSAILSLFCKIEEV